MERLLTCACGEKIVVSRSQAGQEVKCRACGAANQVPTLRAMAELPVHQAATPTGSSSKQDTWSSRGPVLAICMGGLILGAIYSGYQFYLYRGFRVDFDANRHIELDAQGVDKSNADYLLTLWDGYSRMSLGPKSPAEYKLYNDYANRCFRAAAISGSIAGILALVAAGTLASARSTKRG